MKDIYNYSLLAHNTFGIEAKCSRFLEYSTVEEAQQIARELGSADCLLLILGSGSNLLLVNDFEGTVVHSAIKGMQTAKDDVKPGEVLLECGSGETFDDVVAYAVSQGWSGAENLSLIPGEVGASAVQNIGAYGVEAKDIIYKIEAVEMATGELVTIYGEDCDYAYRQSRFKKEWKNKYLITHVTYKLATKFEPHLDYGNIRSSLEAKGIVEPTLGQLRDTIIEIRESKLPDPKVLGNAGSFFMNPIVSKEKYEELAALYPGMPHYTLGDGKEKIPAGWMIDQCGWKGKSLGPAGVHDRQALVLVNRGGATGSDIVRLYTQIRKDVFEKFGIEINPEVNVI